MSQRFFELAFTPGVLSAQRHYYGSEGSGSGIVPSDDRLGTEEATFIAHRGSFYMTRRFASVNDQPIREKDRKFRWPQGPRPMREPRLAVTEL